MSEHAAAAPARQAAAPERSSKGELMLQRKCACGQHTIAGEECAECKKKRMNLQRWSSHRPRPDAALRRNRGAGASDGALAVAASHAGLDLSSVRTQTPALRTALRIQRAPEDGPAAESTAEAAPEAAETPEAPAEPPPPSGPSPEAGPEEAPGEGPEASPEAAPSAAPGAALLVEDDATEVAPGQLRKSEFLDQLEHTVCAEADAALAETGRSTDGCPYLAQWFGHYRGQSAARVEAALRRYAPETRNARTAAEYIPLVAARVRQGVERWARTGEITGVPEGLPLSISTGGSPGAIGAVASGGGSLLFKAREGGARAADDPAAVHAELGAGSPLESGVRGRMERAFGSSFSGVRMHTDASAGRLSAEQNARAFTVGGHVAFAAGEYQPGTVVGDALIAHELAHVIQQRGAGASVAAMEAGSPGYGALEEDADQAAASVVATLWGGAQESLADLAQNAIPRLRSGLRLSRCSRDDSRTSARSAGTQSPAAPTAVECPTQTVTMSGARCGRQYGAIGTYCYSGAAGWWFKEKVLNGSPNTCDTTPIGQTPDPFQSQDGCVDDEIVDMNGPPKNRAPCKDVTNQTVFAGPTKAEVEKCKYKNEQVIEVTVTPGSNPRAGKVITSSAGKSTECNWTA